MNLPQNIDNWILENKSQFLPPICNKMFWDKQLKVFFVGGPNQRNDYHCEEGEELFYMKKGNMVLKILQKNEFKDIHICEGEIFLLPGKIPHSPQRNKDTIGLVVERERLPSEMDALKFFDEDSKEILYEEAFHVQNLGPQLQSIIERYTTLIRGKQRENEEKTLVKAPSWTFDETQVVEEPFHLKNWINKNREMIRKSGAVRVFDSISTYESHVLCYGFGKGTRVLEDSLQDSDRLLWQFEGVSVISLGVEFKTLSENDFFVVKAGDPLYFIPNSDSFLISIQMKSKKKKKSI